MLAVAKEYLFTLALTREFVLESEVAHQALPVVQVALLEVLLPICNDSLLFVPHGHLVPCLSVRVSFMYWKSGIRKENRRTTFGVMRYG